MSIAKSIAKGAAWTMLFKLLARSLGLISVAILARFLTPADFGVVGLAMATIGALELLSSFSFDIVLIQNQQATRQHYDTAWTITILFQMAIGLMLFVLARPAAAFYDEPALHYALLALACAPIIEGFQNIKIVDFRKKMQFHKDFVFMFSKKLIGFCVTVPAAIYFRNFWALIIGILVSKLAGTILSYLLLPYKPRFSNSHWRELFSFSKWLFINNLLWFLRHRASGFIVGKMVGMRGLGVFEVAYQLSNFTTTELVAPINRAVLPGLSRVASDAAALRDNYLKIIGMIALLALPTGVGIAVVAEPLVFVVLGPDWAEAAPIIAILGIVGAIGSVETNTGTTCVAAGRPDLVAKLYTFYVSVLLILIYQFTARWGLIGTAWAGLVATCINVPVYYTVLLRLLDLRLGVFVGTVWRPIAASICMYGSTRLFLDAQPELVGSIDALPVLIKAIATGTATYTAVTTALWLLTGRPEGAERTLLVEVTRRIGLRPDRHVT